MGDSDYALFKPHPKYGTGGGAVDGFAGRKGKVKVACGRGLAGAEVQVEPGLFLCRVPPAMVSLEPSVAGVVPSACIETVTGGVV